MKEVNKAIDEIYCLIRDCKYGVMRLGLHKWSPEPHEIRVLGCYLDDGNFDKALKSLHELNKVLQGRASQ